MSNKTDRGPPPAPPQAGPIGGVGRPTPVMALQGSSAAGGAGPGLRLAARRAVWESLGLAKMRRGFGEKSRWPAGAAGAVGLDAGEGCV